ncbi:hypothetical protein [Prevotella corporis]|uniref:hypothetical protein n=1 Tax=Prevotella corporis TaxID=28128 RepID=UPI0023F9E37B|nr:hypothetical protein [Prevotella corporis]
MIKILNTAHVLLYMGGSIEVSKTIKAQYYKVGMANFVRQDGLGATAVIEIE